MPRVGNMVTIERTFTDFATDVVYTYSQCETTQWQSSRGERPKVVRSHIVSYSPFLALSSAVLWASGLQVRSKSDSRFEDDPETGVRGGQLPQ